MIIPAEFRLIVPSLWKECRAAEPQGRSAFGVVSLLLCVPFTFSGVGLRVRRYGFWCVVGACLCVWVVEDSGVT